MNSQNPFEQLHQNSQGNPAPSDDSKQSDDPSTKINNPLSVMQPDEKIICEIRRHPIGMLGIYSATGGLLILLALLIFVLGPSIFNSTSRTQVFAGGGLAFIFAAIVILAFVFVANKVYWGNHWVVTSDSITQITQTSLFSKQSAQLSLGNLEDVTVEQNGILAQLFKFGVLRAETAGERSKFMFPYCPHPNSYAQKILAAREVFERDHHGGKQEPYQGPPVPVSVPSAQPDSLANTPQTFEEAAQQYQFNQTAKQPAQNQPSFPDQQPPPGPGTAWPPAPQPAASQQATGTGADDSSPENNVSSASTTPSSFPDSDQPVGGVSTNTHVE